MCYVPGNPRIASMNLRMTADEESMLKECSRILRTTKTAVVVEGIKKVYSELKILISVPYQSFSVLQSHQRYSPSCGIF